VTVSTTGRAIPGVGLDHVVDTRRDDESWRAPTDGRARGRERRRPTARFDARKRYHLAVNGPSDGWMQHTVTEWSPKDVTVRLARALAVAGTVRDPAGKPLRGITVFRATGGNSWTGGVVTDAEGRFEVRDLAAGEVVLRAAVRNVVAGEPGPGVAEARVRAGATGVVLTLDPGLELVLRLAAPDAVGAFASAQVVTVGEDGRNRDKSFVRFESDGVARLRGLVSTDRCAVWMAPDREAACSRARRASGPRSWSRRSPASGSRAHDRADRRRRGAGHGPARDLIGLQARGRPTARSSSAACPRARRAAERRVPRGGSVGDDARPAVAAGGQASFDLKEAR
jgi:hypothetical protein